MPIAPAVRELLQAVVQCPLEEKQELFHRLAAKISDWEATIAIAQQHRIAPLVYKRLVENEVRFPPEALARLREAYDRNAFRSMANAAELITISQRFAEQKIPAMPFKGVVLASSVYGNTTTRPAGDLDVLIFEQDLGQATAVLRKNGYELETKTREDGSPAIENYYEYHFERHTDGMVLELRWRLELTQPRFHHNLGMDWVWPYRRSVELAGVDVPDMDPGRKLLMLCMHGSKHAWSRLIWILDIAQLLGMRPDLDWEATTKEAKRVGLGRALALGVLLARRVCMAEVSAEVFRRFESNREALDLAGYFQEAVFEAPGQIPGGLLPYNVRLLDFQDRARFILSLHFLRPNNRDRTMIRLPRALHGLYYLIRPFRILLDRSAR